MSDKDKRSKKSRPKDVPPYVGLPVNPKGLPTFLLERDRWLCWRAVWKDEAGSYSKMPVHPKTGRISAQSDCASSFDESLSFHEKGDSYSTGIGFSLPDGGLDDIVFVDLDSAALMVMKPGSTDAELEAEQWAQLILDRFPPCYREFSPGGKGIHLIVRGKLERALKASENHKGFELYSSSRYLAMTGVQMEDSVDDVPYAQEAIDWLAEKVVPRSVNGGPDYKAASSSYVPAVLNDDRDFQWIAQAIDNGHLDHAVNDYDPWLTVGMGLHAKFGTAGVDLWDRWSTRSHKYVSGECQKKANGFSPNGPVTFASVVKMAKDGGARFPERRDRKPSVQAVRSQIDRSEAFPPSHDIMMPRPTGGLPEDEYTDLRFCDMVIDRHGDRFRFVESWKSWASWDEKRGVWVMSNVMHLEYFKAFAVAPDTYLGSSGRIRAAAALAASDPKILATPDQFDASPDFINLRNGVYDLIQHKLLDHDPIFMATRQAAVDYEPSSKCPKFLETLELVQPDPEIREFLQVWLGTLLTGRTISQVVVNHGDGANGKTTILESPGLVLGTYYAKMPPNFVAKSKGERHPTELVPLYRARFALASENDITDTMDEAKIKIVTGDGEITARRMHENNWTFKPTHKLAIATNHMPSIVGQDSGIWRRMLFVPWQVTIPEERRQPNYERVIYEEEASGILNWMIDGLKKYQRHGLKIPDKIRLQCAEIQTASNWLSEFVGECLTTQEGKGGFEKTLHIRASKVYERYAEWSKSRTEKPLASNKFNPLLKDRLERMGVRVTKTSNVTRYHGIRIKDENDYESEDWEVDRIKPTHRPALTEKTEDDDPPPF